MNFKTLEIFTGIYKSHQGLQRALESLDIDYTKGEISREEYRKLLEHRFKTGDERVKDEIQRRMKTLDYGLNSHIAVSNQQPKYKRFLHQLVDFLETMTDFSISRAVAFLSFFMVLFSIQVHHVAILLIKASGSDHWFQAYCFAIASEVTAIHLTYSGSKKWVVYFFVIIQVWINFLYYTDLPVLLTQLTLPVFIGIILFSYTEILVAHKKPSPKTINHP